MKDVSIIIVTYNRPLTLLSVIDSYLNQQHVGELIIVDDGSSKDYSRVIDDCERKCDSKKIKFIYKKNKSNCGAAYARRIGLSLAKCNYVLWGEDDLYLEDKYIETLRPIVNDKTAAFGAIYYNMEQSYSLEEKNKVISKQQNSELPFMNWKTIEGYFRLPGKQPQPCLFGHAIYLAPRNPYDLINIYEGYKINGFREETDIQIQLRKQGVTFIYCGFTECYHLKERIGDEKYGGQHKNLRLVQEVYYIINNNIFITRNYEVIKKYNRNIYSAKQLKYEFFKKRILFLWSLIKGKARKVVFIW